jgi:hypothetical protein
MGEQVFLSYAREDGDRLEEVHERLITAGFSPWMDRHSILGGQDWENAIFRAVRDAKVFLAFVSRTSVQKAGMVQRELVHGLRRQEEMPEGRVFIIPVRLDDVELPMRLSRFHCIDVFVPGGWANLLGAVVAATAAATLSTPGPQLADGHIQEKWEGSPGYDVDIVYPVFHGLDGGQSSEELNAFLRGHFTKRLIEERRVRRTQYHQLLVSDIQWNDVSARHAVALPAPGVVSVLMHYCLYWAGAAHPNYDVETFLFTFAPVALHELSDLFLDPGAAIRRLSQICRDDLHAQCAAEGDVIREPDEWIERGTEPKIRNFERFFVTASTLEIHFGPEEVGPCAWGPRRTSISLERLRDLLGPNGPLGFATRREP